MSLRLKLKGHQWLNHFIVYLKLTQHYKSTRRACSVTSVVSNSLQPYGPFRSKLLCPWDSSGKKTGGSCHALLQGIFPDLGMEPASPVAPELQVDSLPTEPLGNPLKMKVPQPCPTLYDPVDCSSPGSSVYGILQARILKWVATPFSRGLSQPRGWNFRQILYHLSH